MDSQEKEQELYDGAFKFSADDEVLQKELAKADNAASRRMARVLDLSRDRDTLLERQ